MGNPQPLTRIKVENNAANYFDKKKWRRSGPRPSTYSSTECNTDAPNGTTFFWDIRSNQHWRLPHQEPLSWPPLTHTPYIPLHRKINKPTEGMPFVRVYYFSNAHTFLCARQFPGTRNFLVPAHSRAPENTLHNPHSINIIDAPTKYRPIRSSRS